MTLPTPEEMREALIDGAVAVYTTKPEHGELILKAAQAYLSILEGETIPMPREPNHAIISAMACSRAVDDEGEFVPMLDLLGFSGENKTHTVLRAAYNAAISAWEKQNNG